MEIIEYIISNEEAGERLDKYLSDKLSDLSRSYIKKLIDDGNIRLKNASSKILKASYKLRSEDILLVEIPEAEKLEIVPENIPLDIKYEDDDLIVVEKPQGMVVHPAAGNYTGTLVNALMYHCGDSLSSINGVERPGIVHRIDKDTSGLLVICKNDKAHHSLAKQFEEHTINRIYSCIVYNHFSDEEFIHINKNTNERRNTPNGYIDTVSDDTVSDLGKYIMSVEGSIARSKNDRKKMCIDPTGRHAVTHIFLQQNMNENFAFVKCKLETGRTHQIRVHLSSVNHPLLGDTVYGPRKCPYNLNGQALHAGTLGFIHPTTGEYMEFESPLPVYFQKLLKRLDTGITSTNDQEV